MRALLKKYLILAGVLYLVKTLIVSFKIEGDIQSYMSAVFILFFIRTLISPIINILILPLNLVTLNLTNWLLQILLIFVWVMIIPQVTVTFWDVPAVNFGSVNLSSMHLSWLPVFIIVSLTIIIFYRIAYWIFK